MLFVRTREDKATMSKPSSKAAVNHEGEEDGRVNPERHGEEAGREEDDVLDRVETCAGEGGRVVALVVQLVDVLVKESTRIRSWQPVDPPWVKKAMSKVVMGFPQVGHEQYPNQMVERGFSQGGSS